MSTVEELYFSHVVKIGCTEMDSFFCAGGDTILNMNDHAFTQMQGDLDQQRLLGDRPPFPSIVDQILAKEVHDKER